jgi:hypothetical protein
VIPGFHPRLPQRAAGAVVLDGADLAREFITGARRVDLSVTCAGRRYPIEVKILRGEKTRYGLCRPRVDRSAAWDSFTSQSGRKGSA